MTDSARPIVWTIAGSDSSGGAGIQADLKTFFDLGVHGCSAITAVTAQSSVAAESSFAVPADTLAGQLKALAADLPARAIKIGQLPALESLGVVGTFLRDYDGFVVCDPVMASSTGMSLTDAEAMEHLVELYPNLSLLTPNVPEAECLTGRHIESTADVVAAAAQLIGSGLGAVLMKGGHLRGDWCQDYFSDGTDHFWLSHRRQSTAHTHGTGCTLSSAVAAFVAQGKSLRDALILASAYVQQGLRAARPLGRGAGPVVQAGWPDRLADYPRVSASCDDIDRPAFRRCDTQRLGLYPIVDSVEWIRKLLPLGVATIQLRIKDLRSDALTSKVAEAVELGREYNARLFINDYWELAIEHGAYGVHLGQEDLGAADLAAIREAGLRLGISTHSEYEWARAVTFKPSYIALGTVFPTTTKPAILIGLDNLNRWVQTLQVEYPLTAIGGIKLENMDAVLASGVGSIAVATAITLADDYRAAVRAFS